jgi:hypothetical protein
MILLSANVYGTHSSHSFTHFIAHITYNQHLFHYVIPFICCIVCYYHSKSDQFVAQDFEIVSSSVTTDDSRALLVADLKSNKYSQMETIELRVAILRDGIARVSVREKRPKVRLFALHPHAYMHMHLSSICHLAIYRTK